jgi:hypothetical protein
MIRGHKPGNYFVTADAAGRKVEGEGRQCCHCQFSWEYHPGSGERRGYCARHDGWLCARPICAQLQAKMLAKFPGQSCISFDDFNRRLRESYEHDPNYIVLSSGIVVPIAWLQSQ